VFVQREGKRKMRILFVGGAHEVGGSCIAVEIAGSWVLVDAGICLAGSRDPLPDFSLLQDKPVRAILVTHAHADHIGALPLIHQAYPTVPIYASRATGLLMDVMFSDALRIMERRAEEEGELPLYVPALVTQMLAQVRPLPIDMPMTLPEVPDVTMYAARAGHIAGAISLGFESARESLVISGDISVTAQRTVLGAQSPRLAHPDLVLLESTYGMRLHANRKAEEDRFVAAVAEGIERGGPVLIPAFGLGRGQEVILILQEAMNKGQIPSFPIYVDGLVRRVCATYQLLPEALSPRLARQISKGYAPFVSMQIHMVRDEAERERIVQGEPACIVSSSGMLTGGPSVWYATRLVGRSDASIYITGYQDEESPGRRLLAVAEKQSKTLELNGMVVDVACTIEKYSLSAHADGGELATYAMQLHPRQVALVHGDDEARAALRARFGESVPVLLPRNGMMIEVTDQHRKVMRSGTRDQSSVLPVLPMGIGGDRVLTGACIEELYQCVLPFVAYRVITARELTRVWYGKVTDDAVHGMLMMLAEESAQRYFVPLLSLSDAFQVQQQVKGMGKGEREQQKENAQWADQHAILAALEHHLGTPSDLYRRSVNPVTGDVTLAFHFPIIARQRYADVLAKVAEEWNITIALTERPHQGMLAQVAQEQLPCDITLRKAPAIFHDRQEIKLECIGVMNAETVQTARQRFFEETGWNLCLVGSQVASVPDDRSVSLVPIGSRVFNMIEALQYAQQRFASCSGYLRVRVQSDTHTLEPRFLFPAVARKRYATIAQEVTQHTGWSVCFVPYVHQEALIRTAVQMLPSGVEKRPRASLYTETQTVMLSCKGEATEESIRVVQETFLEETGWQLIFDWA
jgi:Cft2 family RNA processing exonuclease